MSIPESGSPYNDRPRCPHDVLISLHEEDEETYKCVKCGDRFLVSPDE